MPRARQREAVQALHDRLEDEYGYPRPRRQLDPLEELVLTILSQNTSDTNRDRAWERLRSRFATWEDVVDAPLEDVEDALQPGGLHRTKAKRIRETLRRVHERRGSYDMDHLADMDTEKARQELLAIKGLGAKSVNCILLFSLGRPAFPVDTHVYRVLGRIGVHRCKSLTAANDELQDAIPDEHAYAFHVNVITHGRRVCHARRPECWRCGVADLCGFGDKNLEPPAGRC